jgi:signal transduction histidine kinase
MAIDRRQVWRYVRGLAVPALLWCLVAVTLREPLQSWLGGEERYDRAVLQEWIQEARVFRQTLPEMVDDYLTFLQARRSLRRQASASPLELAQADQRLSIKRGEIQEHLQALGDPATKMYPGQLPLFPTIYRIEVRLVNEPEVEWIVWDSELPHYASQYQEMDYVIHPQATVYLAYQLHAYNQQQQNEQSAAERRRWIIILAIAGTALAFLWLYVMQRRRREHERQRVLVQRQIDATERLRLQEALKRQEAERLREEAERGLLEQKLATQAAEGKTLELKSQLYASVGIMAGSYAHNIKNLLVRPNDLLHRCLESDSLSGDQEHMLHEVRQTLGTVTERLQQILRTVRRDPSRPEMTRLDVNQSVRALYETWYELAREKWKLVLEIDLAEGPLWIQGDLSHLQQAMENLLFNARDATFEMRNHLREEAHRAGGPEAQQRRDALIAAAAWKGSVIMRTRRERARAVLEVKDNGIGMSEEVRRRCTETHFSTKRDNATYEGHSTGMGLGLSFVAVILEHHHAELTVESAPLSGATFHVSLPIID